MFNFKFLIQAVLAGCGKSLSRGAPAGEIACPTNAESIYYRGGGAGIQPALSFFGKLLAPFHKQILILFLVLPLQSQVVTSPAGTAFPGVVNGNNVALPGSLTVGTAAPTGAPKGTVGALVVYSPNNALSIKAFGAIGDGVANDTAAIAATLTAARATPTKSVFIPAGVYLTDTITGISKWGMTVFGEGTESSVLKSRTGTNVIETTGSSMHSISLRDFGIDGSRGAANHGIYFHDNNFVYDIWITHITIRNVGGRAIYIPISFSSTLDHIQASSLHDNVIEIGGGPSVILRDIYVQDVGAGKAGYRILSGGVSLINCNGINHGTNADWGVFGQSMAEDGVNAYAHVILTTSNIEDFTRYGVRVKGGSTASFFATTFLAAETGPLEAIQFAGSNSSTMTFDGASSILTKGGAWKNGYAIHSLTTCPPMLMYTQFNSYTSACYSDSLKLAYPTLQVGQASVALGIGAANFNYLASPEAFFTHEYGNGPVPAIASGFGTNPAIAGYDRSGRLTVGRGGTASTGVITWGTAYQANRTGVNCAVRDKTTPSLNASLDWVETKSTLTITSAAPFGAGDVLAWVCVGY
jgi:hypothetical protein